VPDNSHFDAKKDGTLRKLPTLNMKGIQPKRIQKTSVAKDHKWLKLAWMSNGIVALLGR